MGLTDDSSRWVWRCLLPDRRKVKHLMKDKDNPVRKTEELERKMKGDRMSNINKVNESDWKLFRSRLPIWQEAYMERLNREYIALLSGPGPASEKFWELEKRVREDKKCGGVVMRMSRTYMKLNILSLLSDGVISTADLDGFSNDLQEKLAFVLQGQSGWNHVDN